MSREVRLLPRIARRLLLAEGPNCVPLDSVQLHELCDQLERVSVVFLCHPNVLAKTLDDPQLRAALLQALAVVLRWLPDFNSSSSCLHRRLLNAVISCIRNTFLDNRSYTQVAVFTGALFRSQTLQCASRHVAAASEVLRAALVRPDSDPALHAAAGSGDGAAERVLEAIHQALLIAETMLTAIFFPAARCDTAEPVSQSFVSALVTGLRDSAFLEHVAVGLALAAQLLNAEDPATSAAAQPGCAESDRAGSRGDSAMARAGSEMTGQEVPIMRSRRGGSACRDDDIHRFLRANLSHFGTAVAGLWDLRNRLAASQSAAFASPSAALSEVLSGPCLQHLVAAVGICELHLTDGGPTFGLSPNPRNYRLNMGPPQPEDVPAALADSGGWVMASDVPFCALLHILPSYDLASSPLPGWRPACELALRVARTARDCAQLYVKLDEMATGACTAGPSTSAAGAGCQSGTSRPCAIGGGELGAQVRGVLQPAEHGLQRLLPRRDIMIVYDEALRTALKIQAQNTGAPGWAALAVDRWRLTIAAMDCYFRWPGADPNMKARVKRLMGASVGSALSDCYGCVPPQPPPEVAAALEAGLLLLLERIVRRAAREPNSREAQVLPRVLVDNRPFCLVHLIIYGDATQAASCTASFAKALRHAEQLKLDSPDLIKDFVVFLLLDGPAMLSEVAGHVAGCSAATGRQLGRLVSVAVHECLRTAVAVLPNLCPPSVRVRLAFSVRCVSLVLQGLPDTVGPDSPTAAAAEGSGSRSATGPEPPEARAGPSLSGGPLDAPVAAPPAADWRLHVLRSADAITILGLALRRDWQDDEGVAYDVSWVLHSLADAMCRAAVFMPAEVRAAAREGGAILSQLPGRSAGARRSGGGGGAGRRSGGQAGARRAARDPAEEGRATPPSYWPPGLVRGLATQLRAAAENKPALSYGHLAALLDALAEQLELWAGGGQEDPRAGPLGTMRMWTTSVFRGVARLLVSPAELRGLLGRCCAHPDCVNLEGDSEAGLRLQGCGRCGEVAYCCKACQRAHWAAGHKAQCAGRG